MLVVFVRAMFVYVPRSLQGILIKSNYDHLMLLHNAIRLLLDNDNCRNDADYANNLLGLFVSVSSSLYGLQFVSFYIHGLTHLSETVRSHGSLEETSAFLFENELQILKNKVRQCGRALEQIVRRIDEELKTKVLMLSSRDFDVNDPVLLRGHSPPKHPKLVATLVGGFFIVRK
jgi:hypothetical protein